MNDHVPLMEVPVFTGDFRAAIDRAVDFLHEPGFHQIATPNTEFIMMARKDPQFRALLSRTSLNLPDGFGLVWASGILGLGINEKIAGVDFMAALLESCARQEKSVYVLGGAPDSLEAAIANIAAAYPGLRITGHHHGYFGPDEEMDIVGAIAQASPDVLFVALGAPKQEWFIDRHREGLGVRIAIGVGGSVDIWSGKASRAPRWMIDLGLEWLHRLVRQPSRLLRMMVIPRFMAIVVLQRIFKR